jgi:hypothetical protein
MLPAPAKARNEQRRKREYNLSLHGDRDSNDTRAYSHPATARNNSPTAISDNNVYVCIRQILAPAETTAWPCPFVFHQRKICAYLDGIEAQHIFEPQPEKLDGHPGRQGADYIAGEEQVRDHLRGQPHPAHGALRMSRIGRVVPILLPTKIARISE